MQGWHIRHAQLLQVKLGPTKGMRAVHAKHGAAFCERLWISCRSWAVPADASFSSAVVMDPFFEVVERKTGVLKKKSPKKYASCVWIGGVQKKSRKRKKTRKEGQRGLPASKKKMPRGTGKNIKKKKKKKKRSVDRLGTDLQNTDRLGTGTNTDRRGAGLDAVPTMKT